MVVINSGVNLINHIKTSNRTTSDKLSNENKSESFSNKLSSFSKDKDVNNAETKSNINGNKGSEQSQELNSNEQEDLKVSSDNSSNNEDEKEKKINDLILSLFQGKIDFNKFNEEINSTSISEDEKKLLVSVVSLIINGQSGNMTEVDNTENYLMASLTNLIEDQKASDPGKLNLLNGVLKNITSILKNNSIKDSNYNNDELIENIKGIINNLTEEINKDSGSTLSLNSKDETINTLLASRFVLANKSNAETSDIPNKSELKADDILNALTQKKSDKNETAMLKINSFFNSLSNNNQQIEQVSDAPLVINKNNVVDDVIRSIKFMNSNQIKELTVKINPKELGEVVIKLVVDGNNMKASIQASNKETYNLLNSQVNELSKNLQSIKVQEVSINIYQEDTTFFAGQFNGQSQNEHQNNSKRNLSTTSLLNLDDVDDANEPLIDSNINALA